VEDDKQSQTPEEQTEPTKGSRATQEELQERVSVAEDMLVKGYSERFIKRYIAKSEKKSYRTAERAVSDAKAQLALKGEDESAYSKGILKSRINSLFLETTTGPNKNLDQAIRVVQIEAGLLPKNQKTLKGKQKNESIEPHGATEPTLSPELQSVIDRIRKQPAKSDLPDSGEST